MVILATAGGAAAAMHIGKAAAALPLMQADVSATLAQAAIYLSMISASAALTGFAMGRATSAIGVIRAGVIGLLLMSLASLVGAVVHTPLQLLLARMVEAIGLPLVVTAMPAIVQQATIVRDRPLALGIWAAWLPVGVALSMALAFAVLDTQGWRVFFAICGMVSLSVAGLMFLARGRVLAVMAAPQRNRLPDLSHPLYRMALVFFLFSAANMIFMGFLPSVLVNAMHYGTGAATTLGFFSALLLLPTNIATGAAVGSGVRRQSLMLLSFFGIGLSGLVFFSTLAPDAWRFGAALMLGTSTGIAPALIWSAIPALAEDSDVAAPIVAGVLYQAAGLGQVVGPIVAGMFVEVTRSWSAAGLSVLVCSVAAIAIASLSRAAVGFR